ncbi:MAG TPA: hypothetical protein VF074_08055 [Pyrinomonadaceae bacterium]
MKYNFSVPVGRLEGTGANVIWHFRGIESGTYQAEVLVEDVKGNKAKATLQIRAVTCTSCDPGPPPCPKVTVVCPTEIEKRGQIEFVVKVRGGEPIAPTSYSWTTDAGTIVRGEHEGRMIVDISLQPLEKVTASVIIGGYDPSCISEASCTTKIKQ